MALTSKQEKFCQGIVSGLNQSDAYRAAYSCDGMLDATVNNEAYKTIQLPDISARIEHLRRPIAERIGMDLESYLKEMIALKYGALDNNEHSPAIKAHELVGKCLGYYVNKTELTGKNGEALNIKLTKEIIDTDQDKTS